MSKRNRYLGLFISGVLLISTATACVNVDRNGVDVSMPGVNVKTDRDGVRVKLPGINVDTSQDGTYVKIPGISINTDSDGAAVDISSANMPRLDIIQTERNRATILAWGEDGKSYLLAKSVFDLQRDSSPAGTLAIPVYRTGKDIRFSWANDPDISGNFRYQLTDLTTNKVVYEKTSNSLAGKLPAKKNKKAASYRLDVAPVDNWGNEGVLSWTSYFHCGEAIIELDSELVDDGRIVFDPTPLDGLIWKDQFVRVARGGIQIRDESN